MRAATARVGPRRYRVRFARRVPVPWLHSRPGGPVGQTDPVPLRRHGGLVGELDRYPLPTTNNGAAPVRGGAEPKEVNNRKTRK